MSGASGNATGGSAGMAGGAAGGSGGANASCPGSTNHAPGTRLRGRFIVTAEGDRAWNGWHDTELDEECSFSGLANAGTRCIPGNWQNSLTFYTDAACTSPAYTAGRSDACQRTNYIVSYRAGDCTTPSGYELYELGEPVTATVAYSLSEAGLCTQVAVTNEPLYLRGAPVPPDTFVAAEPFTAEGTTRVRATGHLATDGTRQVMGWKDTSLDDTLCGIRRSEDGEHRCLPHGHGLRGENYADAACTERLGTFTSSCGGEPPRYAMIYANAYCPADGDAMTERGETFTGSVHVDLGAGVCEPSTLPVEEPLSRATPVPASAFQATSVRTDESDPGRLKPHYHTSEDGGCWFWKFWDTELGIGCSFDLAEDGVQRCLPGDLGSFADMYTDATCTVPVRVMSLAECKNPVIPEYALDGVATECDTRWRVQRTAPVTTELYHMQLGQCVQVQDTSALALATPVDPTTFMPGELRVE